MRLLSSLLLTCSFCCCVAQDGYNIHFRVTGLRDTTAYLGYFINESTFIKDTAHVDAKGEFAFQGAKPLSQGVYMLVLSKPGGRKAEAIRQFEFVVSSDQDFSLSTDTANYVEHMRVSGDADNSLFFENIHFNIARNKEAEPFFKVIRDSTLSEDQKKTARDALNKINDKVMAYQDELIQKNPGALTAKIIKAHRPVKVPDPPRKPDGSIDSTFQLKWYREHFFDNFDLSDDAMLRLSTPMYRDKINEYLDRLYAPVPDSLTAAVVRIVSKAKPNPETYKYAVFLCMLKFQNNEIMGLDEVYVNLYDKYFATGEMDFWANASMKKAVKDEAERFRKSLVGQKGDNLIMLDSNLKPRALYDVKHKYTILYIFNPDCGHCKIETPKLVSFYGKTKFDVGVFAVSTDTSMVKMRNYIRDMKMNWTTVNGPRTYVGPYSEHYDANTTPSLYVLDSKKMIIGKKVPADKLEDFLTQYERVQRLRGQM